MTDLPVKITKVRDGAVLPTYQTDGAAGMDLCACIDSPIILKPMERMAIPSGIAIELPIGFEAQIRPRSGLSSKFGITMINGVGTIDSDYRGEMSILLVNLGNSDFTIEPGMRIAQMVVARYERVTWLEVNDLGKTDRGTKGFGSTGLK